MNKYIFLRVFINSPSELKSGHEFVNLLSIHLEDIATPESTNVERYYKIPDYVEIFMILVPVVIDNDLIDSFHAIKEKLGNGWSDQGTTILYPEGIWIGNKNNVFFADNVMWANLGFSTDYEENDEEIL
jgi:hypothetical protein